MDDTALVAVSLHDERSLERQTKLAKVNRLNDWGFEGNEDAEVKKGMLGAI